jgi:hypothetical protein
MAKYAKLFSWRALDKFWAAKKPPPGNTQTAMLFGAARQWHAQLAN